MTALLAEGSVDPMPIGPRSHGAFGFRFDPMTHPVGQRPSLAGAVIASLTVGANGNPSVSIATGAL